MVSVECGDTVNNNAYCTFDTVALKKMKNGRSEDIGQDEKIVPHCIVSSYKTSLNFTKIKNGFYSAIDETFSCNVFFNATIELVEPNAIESLRNYEIKFWETKGSKPPKEDYCKEIYKKTIPNEVITYKNISRISKKSNLETIFGLGVECKQVSFDTF